MLQINIDITIEEMLKKYMLSSESSAKEVLVNYLFEKKRKYKLEMHQMLRRYSASSSKDIEEMIKKGTIPGHPAWEDIIQLENLTNDIRDIEKDIEKLS